MSRETGGIVPTVARLIDRYGRSTHDVESPLWPVALARISMGVLWLFSLRWKIPPDFDGRGETSLKQWLELEVEHPAFAFYGSLVESLVLPNFTLFAWLVFVAELLVGLSLLLGYRTSVGAFLGLLMSVNLGIGLLEVPGEWPWSYAMMTMLHGIVLVSPAGLLWGLDGRRMAPRTRSQPANLKGNEQ